VIGIKEVGRGRALTAGMRSAVSANTVRGGLDMLRGRGVEIVELYDAIGAAHVRMDPSLAPALRQHPLVDYLEPRQIGRIDGSPFRGMALFSLPFGTPQTTPWGIAMVRAPEA
jgi:hypothetical protein